MTKTSSEKKLSPCICDECGAEHDTGHLNLPCFNVKCPGTIRGRQVVEGEKLLRKTGKPHKEVIQPPVIEDFLYVCSRCDEKFKTLPIGAKCPECEHGEVLTISEYEGQKKRFDELKNQEVLGVFIPTHTPEYTKGLGVNDYDVGNSNTPEYTKHHRDKNEDNTPKPLSLKGGVLSSSPKTKVIKKEIKAYYFGHVPEDLLKPPEWILKDKIPKQGKVFIGAPVSSFKSTTALYFAVHLASGRPIWDGSASKPTKVWYIDEEDVFGHIYDVVKCICSGFTDEEKKLVSENLILSSGEGINTDDVEVLHEKIRELKPEVVFFDTFRKLTLGDVNDSKIVNFIDNIMLAPVLNELGLTWVILHHNTKRTPKDPRSPDDFELMAGSGYIAGLATVVFMVEKLNEGELALYTAKNKWGRPAGRLLYLRRNDGSIDFEDGGELEVGLAAAGKMAHQIVQHFLKAGIFEKITSKMIKEKFGMSGSTDRAITILKDSGRFVGTGKDNRSPFRLIDLQTKIKGGLGDV